MQSRRRPIPDRDGWSLSRIFKERSLPNCGGLLGLDAGGGKGLARPTEDGPHAQTVGNGYYTGVYMRRRAKSRGMPCCCSASIALSAVGLVVFKSFIAVATVTMGCLES